MNILFMMLRGKAESMRREINVRGAWAWAAPLRRECPVEVTANIMHKTDSTIYRTNANRHSNTQTRTHKSSDHITVKVQTNRPQTAPLVTGRTNPSFRKGGERGGGLGRLYDTVQRYAGRASHVSIEYHNIPTNGCYQ